MLVISRSPEETIVITGPEGGCSVTVLRIRGQKASLLITYTSSTEPGLQVWSGTLGRDEHFKADSIAEISIVDIRAEKARLGIETPKSAKVQRLEVWQASRPNSPRSDDDEPEDGFSGARVPRPGDPLPPSLDVRLNEPGPDDNNVN